MFSSRTILMLSLAVLLGGCAVTPKIQLSNGGLAMEVKSEVPIIAVVDYSPDGKSVVTGGIGGTARLWDLTSARQAMKFLGHPGSIVDVAYSPDGKTIAVASSGGTTNFSDALTTFWDVASGSQIKKFTDNYGGTLSFSPDGRFVSGSTGGVGGYSVELRDVQSGSLSRKFKGAELSPVDGIISPNGKYIAIWGRDVSPGSGMMILSSPKNWYFFVTLVDIANGQEKWKTTISFNSNVGFSAVTFSPDSGHLLIAHNNRDSAAAHFNMSFKLLDSATGALVKEFAHTTLPAGSFSGGEYEQYVVQALAFSPDGKSFLSGDQGGRYKLWDVATGTMVRQLKSVDEGASNFVGFRVLPKTASVKFSPDSKSAVITSLASTRLFDVSTGDELATMISFEDGEWLVTTPNGYYNSSENGDRYLNVTVDGKPYSISQLRESFFRPDLVKLAFAGGSIKEFKKIADIKPPPSVSIVDAPKATQSDEVKVTLKINDSGGGVGDIRLYLNGSAVVLDNSRGVEIVPKADGSIYKSYTVRLTSGKNTIRAIAFNAENTMQSTDTTHEITASFKSSAKPSLYAIVIGINEYKNPKLTLNFAVADAQLFSDSLQAGASGIFDKVIIKRLTTRYETTSANITAELKTMQTLNPDDLFVFYVASHGAVDDGEYFLITSNVGSTSTAKLKTDAIDQSALKGLIANIPTAKKLIVIDTCNAGALGDAIQTAMLTRGMSEDTAMKVLSRAVGSTILSAATGLQEALEGYNQHGLFTYVLSQGLSGKADSDKDGFVKTTELANYVDDEVPALAERIFNKAQYPTVAPSGHAFPIGRVQ